MNTRIFSVTQINRYIKSLLEEDIILENVLIEGELSNFKHHYSGHMYFTLKDSGAAVQCVMFRGCAEILPFEPDNGMKVICGGRVSLYEKTGQYQLYVETMEPAGKGMLYMAYEQLKEKLTIEGLFDEKYKKIIPAYPKCIAVITSPKGAVIRDIIQIAHRRNHYVELVVVPTAVQGANAASEISRAIREVNKWGKPDVIIVGRGGGSIEDLWAFNEEAVARAIFGSSIPIISAVGHETDFTIADFVADLRAPTPSAAAELAVPSLEGLMSLLAHVDNRFNSVINNVLKNCKDRFNTVVNHRFFRYPLERIYENQIYVAELTKKLNRETSYKIEKKRMQLTATVAALENVSPLTVLKRGYAVVYKENGERAAGIGDLNVGEIAAIRLRDGEIKAQVLSVIESEGVSYGKEENDV